MILIYNTMLMIYAMRQQPLTSSCLATFLAIYCRFPDPLKKKCVSLATKRLLTDTECCISKKGTGSISENAVLVPNVCGSNAGNHDVHDDNESPTSCRSK